MPKKKHPLEGKAAWTVVDGDGKASDGIGVENVDTKFGTTKLFGIPEATGVAMADVAAAKPAPDAANDEAWVASWLACDGGAGTPPEKATLVDELETGRLAVCWADNTCWTALATAARKAGDVGEKTGSESDKAAWATLEFGGDETAG